MKCKIDNDFDIKKFEKIINKYRDKIRPSKTFTINLDEKGQFISMSIGVNFIEKYQRCVNLNEHEDLMMKISRDMMKTFGYEADYDGDCIIFGE